jgi:hypothetical protein
MDIRKTASYPVFPTPGWRGQPSAQPVEPAEAGVIDSVQGIVRGDAGTFGGKRPQAQAPDGPTEIPTDEGAAKVQRQRGPLSIHAQQALQAYLSHENLAQQESRDALNQALGVDYYV